MMDLIVHSFNFSPVVVTLLWWGFRFQKYFRIELAKLTEEFVGSPVRLRSDGQAHYS